MGALVEALHRIRARDQGDDDEQQLSGRGRDGDRKSQ
jgi:hypothetical protein